MDHIIEIERKHNGHLVIYVDRGEPIYLMPLDSLDAKIEQIATDEHGTVRDKQEARMIINPIG